MGGQSTELGQYVWGLSKAGYMNNKKVIGGYRWGIKANNDPNGSKWEYGSN